METTNYVYVSFKGWPTRYRILANNQRLDDNQYIHNCLSTQQNNFYTLTLSYLVLAGKYKIIY